MSSTGTVAKLADATVLGDVALAVLLVATLDLASAGAWNLTAWGSFEQGETVGGTRAYLVLDPDIDNTSAPPVILPDKGRVLADADLNAAGAKYLTGSAAVLPRGHHTVVLAVTVEGEVPFLGAEIDVFAVPNIPLPVFS